MAASLRGGSSGPSAGWTATLRLFTSRATSDLYGRQVAAVNRLIRKNGNGFAIRHLAELRQLLELVADAVAKGREVFVVPLCGLLELCGKPFVRDKANAEFRNAHVICAVLTTISALLKTSPSVLIKVAAAQMLCNFAKGSPDAPGKAGEPNKHPDDMRPSAWSYNQQLLERSGSVLAVVGTLRDEVDHLFAHDDNDDGVIDEAEYARAQGHDPASENADTPVYMVSLMKVVLELSAHKTNALIITQEQAPLQLVRVCACLQDFRKEEVAIMIEVLWNVLEQSNDRLGGPLTGTREQLLVKHRYGNAMWVLGNAQTVGMMRSLLERILLLGYRKSDKELRNELLVVATMLSKRRENHRLFLDGGVIELLLQYATAAEMELPTECDWHRFATSECEDQEMKQLIWVLLVDLCEFSAENQAAVTESLLIPTLLLYVDLRCSEHPARKQWSSTQTASLQLDALALLFKLAPKCPKRFLELEGNSILLNFLHSQPDRALFEAALRLVLRCVDLPGYAEQLGELGAVEMMLEAFGSPDVPAAHKELAVSTLSLLCARNIRNQTAFRRADGVAMLLACLKYDPSDFVHAEHFLIAVVDCTWSAVVGNRRSEARFIAADGVDALLDLLELCPEMMRPQLLGCLADLLRNRNAAPYFRGWKSDVSMCGAAQLALSLWVQEEKRLNIRNDGVGVLANMVRPLDGVALSCTSSGPEASPIASPQTSNDSAAGFAESEEVAALTAKSALQENRTSSVNGNFTRLREALEAAKALGRPADESVLLLTAVQQHDARAKVYAALAGVGFATLDRGELKAPERVALCVAEHFPEFREASLWADVTEELDTDGLVPILADRLHVQKKRSDAKSLAENTRLQQLSELESSQRSDVAEEEAFYVSIKQKREQEEQSRLMAHRLRAPSSTMQYRKQRKRQKQAMLERSLQKPARGRDDDDDGEALWDDGDDRTE